MRVHVLNGVNLNMPGLESGRRMRHEDLIGFMIAAMTVGTVTAAIAITVCSRSGHSDRK